jgi:hypothetical protein
LILRVELHEQNRSSLECLADSLDALHLPTVDAMRESFPYPRRERSIQEPLEAFARLLGEHWNPTEHSLLHDWLAQKRRELLPYLHGRNPRPDRRRLHEMQINGTATFWTTEGESIQCPFTLEDLCELTGRGFHIATRNLPVSGTFDGNTNLIDFSVDGRQCRMVPLSAAGVTLPVTSVVLSLRRTVNGAELEFHFVCGILRAWSTTVESQSGWALLANPDTLALAQWQSSFGLKN